VVIEVTERAVAGDPARLLATVAQAREAGWGVAAHIINTVRAHAERTDAVVIAEGIETIKRAREAIPLRAAAAEVGAATPWELMGASREPRRATRDLLVEMCLQLEHQGLDAAEPNVLLACFRTRTTSPRPPAAGMSSWPPGRGSPACSATACRSPRLSGSAAPTWPPTTRCAASGTWS